jgi:hypothetical protein
MELDFTTTAIIAGLSAAVAAFCGFMGARPLKLDDDVRLVPWRFIMLLAATVTIIMVVHLLTLSGLKTDPPVKY